MAWYKSTHSMDNLSTFKRENAGKELSFTDKNGNTVTGILQADGKVKVGNQMYGGLYKGPDNQFRTDDAPTTIVPPAPAKPSTTTPAASTGSYYNKVTNADIKAKGMNPNSLVDALKVATGNTGKSNKQLYSTIGTLAQIASKNGISGYKGTAAQNMQILNLLKQGKLKKYATGGLVDNTGLAWLDGTKSKPEIVLDAKDSENFIQLKDLLASNMGKLGSLKDGKGGGDNYFTIEVNVQELSEDYDVEQVAEKIKEFIAEDSRYRNVNVIEL